MEICLSANLQVLPLTLYSSSSSSSSSSPEFPVVYQSDEEQERLMGLYQDLHSCLHHPTRPLCSFYRCGETENLLAWVRHCVTCDVFSVFQNTFHKTLCTNILPNLTSHMIWHYETHLHSSEHLNVVYPHHILIIKFGHYQKMLWKK